MDDFGDEIDLHGSLATIFTKSGGHRALTDLQNSHGNRFSSRILENARAQYAPGGARVPLAFPQDIKRIELASVDMRASLNPANWKYQYEVEYVRPVDGVHDFISSFTGCQLAFVLLAYDNKSPHYQAMIEGADRYAQEARYRAVDNIIEKARGIVTPGPKKDI